MDHFSILHQPNHLSPVIYVRSPSISQFSNIMGHSNKHSKRHSYEGSPSAGMLQEPGMLPPASEEFSEDVSENLSEDVSEKLPVLKHSERHSYAVGTRSPPEEPTETEMEKEMMGSVEEEIWSLRYWQFTM
jgi:hypothetical protein